MYGWGDGFNGHPHAPLPEKFPRALVEFLLTDPDVIRAHDCEDCGLEVPVWRTNPGPTESDRRPFATCPNCGGRTGWYAYYAKHIAPAKEAARGTR